MSSYLATLAVLAAALAAGPVWPATAPNEATGAVHVIPIRGEIDKALVYIVRRGLDEAQRRGARAIVFEIDTPGGRVDVVEAIIKLLKNVTVPTYTLVDPNAISAGAIIAMATDHIYMTPGSRIGDARPVLLGMLGAPNDMPSGIEEKSVSYVAALIRASAQEHGHDPKLAESMVRREVGYAIGGEMIVPTGQIATLTSQEAERMVGQPPHRLLSEGTVRDRAALLDVLGLRGARLTEFKVSEAEHLARIIESISIILLAGGLIGIYIEFKTPGFGLPGIAGILLLAIWFWGHHIAGLAGMEEITLFIIGIALLALEVFVIPGFGIVGAAGLVCVAAGLVLGMIEHAPGASWMLSFDILLPPMAKVAVSLLLALGGGLLAARFLPETRAFRNFVLADKIESHAGVEPARTTPDLVGHRGTTLSPLRPSGIAMFGDLRLQVTTETDFIDQDRPIIITAVDGNRIIVEPSPKV